MQIKGIFIISDDDEMYLLEISYDEQKLKNRVLLLDDNRYVIKDVILFIFSTYEDDKYLLSRAISYKEDFVKNKIFAMNYQNGQVLLNITSDYNGESEEYKNFVKNIKQYKIFENCNISQNRIDFDKYYDESVMNA